MQEYIGGRQDTQIVEYWIPTWCSCVALWKKTQCFEDDILYVFHCIPLDFQLGNVLLITSPIMYLRNESFFFKMISQFSNAAGFLEYYAKFMLMAVPRKILFTRANTFTVHINNIRSNSEKHDSSNNHLGLLSYYFYVNLNTEINHVVGWKRG